MSESKASRTLLKSPPELWSEVSTATSLQRHMDQFGEIRITKLEPETAVAWEGEHARGTIKLEVSGWGTKVSLTAEPVRVDGVDGTGPDAADVVDTEPSDDLVESEAANHHVKPEPAESIESPDAVAPGMPDRTISPQHDGLEAPMQRPRWTRRLARAFEKWFGPARLETADPVAHGPEPEPEHPAAWPVVAGEPTRPATPTESAPTPEPTPVAAEPEHPAASQSPTSPPASTPEQEPPPQLDDASTAALDAALESLGQAHHRPFSRA